jgi:hypothetical protein
MSSPATSKFIELEECIARAIEAVKTTREERDKVRKDLFTAQGQIARLELQLTELRRERELVKNKVETVLQNLAELTD